MQAFKASKMGRRLYSHFAYYNTYISYSYNTIHRVTIAGKSSQKNHNYLD